MPTFNEDKATLYQPEADTTPAQFNEDKAQLYTPSPPQEPGFWPAMGQAVRRGYSRNPLAYGASVMGDIEAGQQPSMTWEQFQEAGKVPGEVLPSGDTGLIARPLESVIAGAPFTLYPPLLRTAILSSQASEVGRQLGWPKIAQEGLAMGAGALSWPAAARSAPGFISNFLSHHIGERISSVLGAGVGHYFWPGLGTLAGLALGQPIARGIVGLGGGIARRLPGAIAGGAAGMPDDPWNEGNELTRAQ
jgi:hypothetical protein